MIKLCECGCGQPTNIATKTDKRQRTIKGEYNRFIYGHSSKGKNNAMYGVHRFGKNSPNYGKCRTEEWKKENSKGENNPYFKHGKTLIKYYCQDCGKKISYCSTYCIKCHKANENNGNWQGGISSLKNRINACFEYKQWRTKIFTRDNFTCQECGNQKSGIFEAHHSEESFAELLTEFLKEYNQFSPYEDQDTLVRLATKWQPFWDAEGETLCEDCHKEKHKEMQYATTSAER